MAFADLAANQMVDENNASTGGFTAIGPKNAANQCYTKAQALAAYNLNVSNMSAYADNQLVPKSVWVSGVSPSIEISPGQIAINSMRGQDNAAFSVTRNTGGGTTLNNFNIGCSLVSGIYSMDRVFLAFDVSAITAAIQAKVKITVSSNTELGTRAYLVQHNSTSHPPNYAWGNSNWTEGLSGTPLSTGISVTPGQVGDVIFDLNVTGINLINSSSTFCVVIRDAQYDVNNVAPPSLTNKQQISGGNASIKLIIT